MRYKKLFLTLVVLALLSVVFQAKPASAATTTARPTRLIIPSIQVNADVNALGITRSGNMAAPGNFSDVGWYKYAPQPGAVGNAIIDGHYESGTNGKGAPVSGVFQNLHAIQTGADIEVLSSNGKVSHFRVTSVGLMSKDASMTPIMTSDGTARLVLITCAGTWLPQQGTFSQRLIVTAVLA